MTAREMITISNGVNRNSDEEMIARIEKRIEENASKGKTYVSIPQNKLTKNIFEYFEQRGFSFKDSYCAGMTFVHISWADAEPLTDFDFKSYLMERKLRSIEHDF
jgi:hypothetical protein